MDPTCGVEGATRGGGDNVWLRNKPRGAEPRRGHIGLVQVMDHPRVIN